MNELVSVIIPARVEPYVNETIRDIVDNAAGEIEIILILDGWIPDYNIKRRKGLRILRNERPAGRRNATNQGVEAAKGKYIYKIDAHCTIGPGWDEILKADCADNWIVVPRRFSFDAPTWTVKKKPPVDAMSYVYPFRQPYKPRLTTRPDRAREQRQAHEDISVDMGWNGASWFMHKSHYLAIGGQDAKGYGPFAEEPEELGLKTQLGPRRGSVVRNKKTWFAHWAKPAAHWNAPPDIAGRCTDRERELGYLYCWDYWWHNRWKDRVYDFEWLVDKFWPLPGWPENWRRLTKQYTRYKMEELWPDIRAGVR